MAFPRMLFVKKMAQDTPIRYTASPDQAALVEIDPVAIATYQLVLTKRWKRVIVPDWTPGTRSRPRARPPQKRSKT